MKKNDTLWKGILENLCEDFILFFFQDAQQLLDLGKGFEFLDKELEQLFPAEVSEAPKFVDKLVKVFSRQGQEEWVLIHIEVQGYQDTDFAKRMFTYFYRILDKYGKPVTAIAIFTDANKNYHPVAFDYHFLGTRNTFQFNTYKIIDQDEAALSQNENPFAVVIVTVLLALKKKKLDDQSLFELKYLLARNLLKRKIARKKIDDLLIFLGQYVRFADSKYSIKFDHVIEELTEKQSSMGIREMVLDQAKSEGKKEGKQESKVDFVENLLAARRFTTEEIAGFADVTEKFVLDVMQTLDQGQGNKEG
jgi:predicted transposase YdaD